MSCLASNLITWLAPRSNMTAPSSHGITRPLNSMIGVPAPIGRAANNPMPLIGDLRFCHSRFRRCSLISSLYSLIGCILPLSHPRRDQRLLRSHFFFAASITLLSSRHDTGPAPAPMGLKMLMCIAASSAKASSAWLPCANIVARPLRRYTILSVPCREKKQTPGDGRRFSVGPDEKLAVFVELESAIRACRELC